MRSATPAELLRLARGRDWYGCHMKDSPPCFHSFDALDILWRPPFPIGSEVRSEDGKTGTVVRYVHKSEMRKRNLQNKFCWYKCKFDVGNGYRRADKMKLQSDPAPFVEPNKDLSLYPPTEYDDSESSDDPADVAAPAPEDHTFWLGGKANVLPPPPPPPTHNNKKKK
jgi:hypothetical protein